MDQQKLMTADYLDIVFDQRNKNYGSYELRRHYNRRVLKGLGSLMLGISALACLSFVNAEKPAATVARPIRPTIFTDLRPEIKQPKIIPPPPAPHVDPPKVNTIHITPPKVVDDNKVLENDLMAKNKDLDHAVAGKTTIAGDTADISEPVSRRHGDVTGVVSNDTKPQTPVHFVPQMPQFAGDLNAYISSHLNYPEAARSAGIEGRVVVEFVVNEDGQVSDARVMKSIGGGCDEEATRMVSGMPKWKPGKNNGTPVKVYFSLPIKFELR